MTPYYPESNSSIERFFRNLKKFVKVCSFQGVELKSELNALLFNFLANDVRGEGVRSSNLSAFVDEQWGVLREEYGVWDSRSMLIINVTYCILVNKVLDYWPKQFVKVYTKLVTSRSYSSTLTSHRRAQQAWSRG